MVVDGQAGAAYDKVGCAELVFSPDSKHVAYRAQIGEKWFVVLDGQAGGEYDQIPVIKLSFNGDGSLDYLAVKDGTLYRVQNVPTIK